MNIDELSPATLTFAKAMADSTRQKIMQACCCQWCSVGDLVERVGVGQPTVSHHLGILRQAGLVHVREEGRQTFYTVNQDSVAACCGRLIERFAPDTELELRPAGAG